MDRSAGVDPKSNSPPKLNPPLATLQGQRMPLAGRLTDGPDHAEVSNRCAASLRVAFKYRDLVSLFRGDPGVRQPKDARTDDSHALALHQESPPAAASR